METEIVEFAAYETAFTVLVPSTVYNNQNVTKLVQYVILLFWTADCRYI